VALIKCVYNLI